MMMMLEKIWEALEASNEFGGARRVNDEDNNDFFCYLDATGKRGLLLISDTEPPKSSPFDAVDIVIGQRSDGRWSLLVVLKLPTLTELFKLLCQDLVDAARGLESCRIAGFVLTRLLRWRRLLEAGDTGLLGISELRGLVGELIVMQHCFDCWLPAEVIEAWVGPLEAPQDFALPSMRLEAKTIAPTATRILISSVDQLDVSLGTDLRLAVVHLANVPSESSDGISPAALISQIREALDSYPVALKEFDSRLLSAGYIDNLGYDTFRFRLNSLKIYKVINEFPRMTRRQLPRGVAEATYEIRLAACSLFESTLRG